MNASHGSGIQPGSEFQQLRVYVNDKSELFGISFWRTSPCQWRRKTAIRVISCSRIIL